MMLLRLLLVCISCTACASCCDSRVESEEPSPSGRMIAKVTYQNCGALSDGTSVRLRAAKRHWWSKDGLVVGASGRHAITVLWKDEKTLRVYLPMSLRERDFVDQKIARRSNDVNGIHIDYRQL